MMQICNYMLQIKFLEVSKTNVRLTYQHYKAGPLTRVGQVLCYFFINQKVGVIGIWCLSLSW